MLSKTEKRREMRRLWSKLRNNMEARAQADMYFITDDGWKSRHWGNSFLVRQFYDCPSMVLCELHCETPVMLFAPRLEWLSPGYWKCRLQGLWQLLQEDAKSPGRFQARMELSWERFRCRAPKRHVYIKQVTQAYLNNQKMSPQVQKGM
eukprot:Gregarina_sp_Poly_1__7902@NODE_44_length_17989_cov_118_013391_g38_i0_p7_GENE_NODE_44_length_17989_cov_118_013391_g38_i0NODE_44_length_17989_cov_118_013391_g38_i0_p7_ORF_typecomplete_len149_score10_33_NODE_44_length_17989_cov_118_013391_g38_i01147411920